MGARFAGASIDQEGSQRQGVLHPLEHPRVGRKGDDGIREHTQSSLAGGGVLAKKGIHGGENLRRERQAGTETQTVQRLVSPLVALPDPHRVILPNYQGRGSEKRGVDDMSG